MGKCESVVKEIRFIIEDELNQVYVLCEAIGDCPLGVQGWHHKTFPPSKTLVDILRNDIGKYLEWPQEAP